MKTFTLFTKGYAAVATAMLISSLLSAQDFKVQHLQDDIGRSSSTPMSITPVASLNRAIALPNNNRKVSAGPVSSAANAAARDMAGAISLSATNTLNYIRQTNSINTNTRFNSSVWEYTGSGGGANEMIVRGRYAITLNGTNNNVTQALSGIVNANDCIPFITGIITNDSTAGADSGTAIAYLENTSTLRVQKGTNASNVTVYITVVEFTGSNWTVLHGDSGNTNGDNGSITLRSNSTGTGGSARSVSDWSEAIIFSHHKGDNVASINQGIEDNWPLMQPDPSNRQRVDWTFYSGHGSNGSNRQFVHVLNHTDLNVTRFLNNSSTQGQTTINIGSAGLSNLNQALIIGTSISNGGGTAYGRGWRNYYFVNTTTAAHWSHRSGNSMNHEIQIVDFAALNTSPKPEINIQGNGIAISDGDTTPTLTDDTEFNTIAVTGATATNTFTIQNTGTLDLSIGAVTLGGANAGDFSVTASPAPLINPGGATTFNITFNPSANGIRNATISIDNNDSDENPYNFSIRGTGITPAACNTLISTFPYEESFENGLGLWTQSTNDGFNWSRTSNTTPSANTGPNEAQDGNFYIYTEASNNSNNTSELISPCFDLSSAAHPRFTFFHHMYGNDMGELYLELSTDNGLSFPTTLYTRSGDIHTSTNSAFTPISIDLSSYIGQTVRLRIRGVTGSGYRSDIAIDMVSFTDKATPIYGPGGITADLGLWLKSDAGHSYTNGQPVTAWEDQGLGSDARAQKPQQAPTYYDNAGRNINFNPVIEFDNTFTSFSTDSDYSYDRTSTEFLSGDYGFYTQELFIVLITDDTPITNSFGYMDVFCSDAQIQAPASDATGIGFGDYTGRVTNEIICYAHDSFTQSDNQDGYAVAEIGTGSSYDNVGIINARNNRSNSQQELYYNANDIETTQNDIAEYMNTNDARWWIGRSEGWEATLNAKVAEVITFSARKDDNNLTQERNKIQSYLGIKYGITLGINGVSQDYVDSDGEVIWDQSANTGYNFDVAGIGRDDKSELNQKQSRSINNAEDGNGRTQGILTMGLSDIYNTNNLNKSNNSETFTDKQFLTWGNNGENLSAPPSEVSLNLSAGISPTLGTNVTLKSMKRVWKVVENGGNIPKVKIRLEENALRNITPNGNYYMFISDTGAFNTINDYVVMTPDGNGNLETNYDFSGETYITFGYAPLVELERSVFFDGTSDYIDMGNSLNVDPSGFTMSAWIKRDVTDTGSKSILSKRNTSFSSGYDLRIRGDNRIQILWRNSSVQSLVSTTTIPNNEWHHVAVIYNGTNASIYIDGVLDRVQAKSAPTTSTNPFLIAAAGNGSTIQHFKGHIDEVRIWDTALSQDQLRFVMNQEIEDNAGQVMGKELPTSLPKNEINTVPWEALAGYYPMSSYLFTITKDASGKGNNGALKNLNTVDRQTAPLPYVSSQDGSWDTNSTWTNGNYQYTPGSTSIVDNAVTVNWNIVRTAHNITMDNTLLPSGNNDNRTMLALYVDANELTLLGDNTSKTGNGLTISHYLNLAGRIDLEGESQLIQDNDSALVVASNGILEKDQQGTADTYTYNYWSAPVGATNISTNNYSYTVQDIMRDGINPINFSSSGYDGAATNPIRIADYWIWKYANLTSDDYSAWQHVRRSGILKAGEGFSMKGPGTGSIFTDQNYVFLGKPNNGEITLPINNANDYLVGNPYASAIDANEFITDNPNTSGTLYFWEHWGGGSHVLREYQGGYALYNLSGGVPAPAPDPDVAQVGVGTKTPGQYIPVAQGFFVTGDSDGVITFENDQRAFVKKGAVNSVFMRNGNASNTATSSNTSSDQRMKFRIGFNAGYGMQLHRQLLLTIDENASADVDWGYDAKLNEDQTDDMFWTLNNEKYIIQARDDMGLQEVYPLGIKVNEDGLNTVTIDALEQVPNQINIYIHDIELDVYHNLRNSDYQVFLNEGEYLERFEITFTLPSDALSIDDQNANSIDMIYSNNNNSIVVINPNLVPIQAIELYNILGQSVLNTTTIKTQNYMAYPVKNLSTGTYIIKLYTNSGLVLTKKVLVQ